MFLPPSSRAFSQFSHRHQKPGYCSPAEVPRKMNCMVVSFQKSAWIRGLSFMDCPLVGCGKGDSP